MNAPSDRIHPSAVVDPSARIDPTARIAESAVIEAEAIVGPACVIGKGTRLRTRSIIVEHTTLGESNDVHPYAVLGGDPQDKSFKQDQRGEVVIGDRNVFREGVTINRSNWNGPATRIGSGCYLMGQAHVGHNAQVGDNVIMANGAGLAGHSRVGNFCVMSGYAGVHQFTTVGDGVMFQAHAAVSMNVPPFVVLSGGNNVAGLNAVGIRRNPTLSATDRDEIKLVFKAIYRTRGATPIEDVLEDLAGQGWGSGASFFITFVRESLTAQPPRRRGLCPSRLSMGRTPRGAGSVAGPSED